MTVFYESQDVEVTESWGPNPDYWRAAKIITTIGGWRTDKEPPQYCVEFEDGSRGVFDTEHIRAIDPAKEYPGLAEPDDDTSEPMGNAT